MAESTRETFTHSSAASSCSDRTDAISVPQPSAHDLEKNSREPLQPAATHAPDTVAKDEQDGSPLRQHATNKSKHTLRSITSVRSRVPSVNDISTVPDGGWRAWSQVIGSFFLFFNTWGLINAFGVSLTYYQTHSLSQWSPSDISWIGSVQAFLLMCIGPLSGPIYDAGYFRALLIAGTVLIPFGLFMVSISHEYWQVFLSQAVCIGVGAGLLFIPSVAILSTYFSTKLATATGIAAAGSSMGGVIYPIALQQLLDRVGWAWANRILGFISLSTLLCSLCLMRVRVLPAERRKIVDLSAFRETPYLIFVLGSFVAFMGLYAPFFYVEYYAITYKITSGDLALYALPILNSGSVLGRILPNYVADRTGPLNVITPACVISGVLALCLIPARTQPSLLSVCVLYGFFSGALVSLPPTVFVTLSSHKRGMIGTRMGMGFFIVSLGLLIGSPVAGAILDGAGYTAVWVFGGVLLIVGGLMFAGARLAKTGMSGVWSKA